MVCDHAFRTPLAGTRPGHRITVLDKGFQSIDTNRNGTSAYPARLELTQAGDLETDRLA